MKNAQKMLAASAAALVLASGLAAGDASAQEFALRFQSSDPAGNPNFELKQEWAERVAERTNGGLEIQVFHSAQLGVEEDIIEQIRQGANIGQNTDAARLGNYVPGIAVVNGPYFVSSAEQAFSLADAPTMQGWLDELATQHGIRVVCFDWVQGFRNFFTNEEIRTPADLEGLRIRTPPAPIWQESIRALGAEPTAMAFGDVYPGLQQRAIDGAELTYPNITAGNLNEVLDVANETKHILLVNFQIVSSQWFDGLPAEYQAALTEECRAAGQATSAEIAQATEAAKQKLIEAGMTIVEDVDMEAFRAAGETAYEALGLSEEKAALQAEIGG